MKYIQCWSGGKDSTASIILERIHGLPKSTIIFSEVMFDKKRGISGELPEHIDWIHNTAIPRFKAWGYDVEVLHSDKDYLDLFYRPVTKSKIPERNGKLNGFLIAGLCQANRPLKLAPITKYFKAIGDEFIQYIGIAADEPERLARLEGTNKVSLLAKYGYTEEMAKKLCVEYNLLSPIYAFTKRNGCWFCPNARISELAYLKQNHPDLWGELKALSQVGDLRVKDFSHTKTFAEVDVRVDKYIKKEASKNG